MGLLRTDSDGGFDADAVERVRLISFASDRGIAAADIVRLSEAQGSDVLARYIDLLGGPRKPGRSIGEAARLAELPEPLVRRFRIAGGLADQEVFDEDLEMMRTGATALAVGLPEVALLQIVRVLADSLTRVADAESRLFHIYVHEQLRASGLSESELVDAVSSISDPLMELIEPSVLYFHRRAWSRALLEDMVVHLREDLAPHVGAIAEVPVAVLFVDLASFTPLTEAMGDTEAARILDRFSDVVREAASRCAGRVLKQIGDEFMIAFPSATAAVSCGLDIRRRTQDEPQFPAVRIGAHSGTAVYREADYLGATVNIAARVAAQAGRGEFLLTEAMRADIDQIGDVRFESLGPRSLKGLAEPVEIVAVFDRRQPQGRTVDPVCGMELNDEHRDIRVAWRGADVYFCSDACRDRFLASPEHHTESAQAPKGT